MSIDNQLFIIIIIVKLIIDTCNLKIKVFIQLLQDKISNTKLAIFYNNIFKVLTYISAQKILIYELDKSYDILAKDVFDILLTTPNSRFN